MVACKKSWCWRSSWEFYIKKHRQEEERQTLGLGWVFEAQEPTLCDILSQTKPHFLIPLKLCWSLMIRHSHIWAHGSHSHLNHHRCSEGKSFCNKCLKLLEPLLNWVMRNDQRYLKYKQEKRSKRKINKYHEMTFGRRMHSKYSFGLDSRRKEQISPIWKRIYAISNRIY